MSKKPRGYRRSNLKKLERKDLLKKPIDLDWVKRRFIPQIEVASDGCRIWKGEQDAKGMPIVNYFGVNTTARRMSWLIDNPNIIPPKSLGVRCGKQLCVYYGHIFVKGNMWRPQRRPEQKNVTNHAPESTKTVPTIEELAKEIALLKEQISASRNDAEITGDRQRRRDIFQHLDNVFLNLGQEYQVSPEEIRSILFEAYGYSKQGK